MCGGRWNSRDLSTAPPAPAVLSPCARSLARTHSPGGTVQFPNQTIYCEKWGTYHGTGCGAPYGNFEYLNPDDGCTNETVNGGYNDYCNPPFAADG